jgi:HdeA/HdeB family
MNEKMPEKIPTPLPQSLGRRTAAVTIAPCTFALLSVATAVFGCPDRAAFAQAQTQSDQSRSDRMIELFTCKDVMRQPSTNREIAIAFLHGYLLGKSGNSKFNVEILESQSNAFIEQCLDNPQSKAIDVMMKAQGMNRQ